MLLSIIVAMDEQGVIGRDGQLPWHLSSDLRRFKRLTMGHCLIMGRRTFESIGRPLPGRVSIVITRDRSRVRAQDGVLVASSFEEAAGLVATTKMQQDEAFVIGGAEIYRLALPRAGRLYLTRVMAKADGETLFPPIDLDDWRLAGSKKHEAMAGDDYDCVFEQYERIKR